MAYGRLVTEIVAAVNIFRYSIKNERNLPNIQDCSYRLRGRNRRKSQNEIFVKKKQQQKIQNKKFQTKCLISQ